MGYRLRMTVAFGVLALASVVVLTLLFLTSSYLEFKSDRMVSVERMTACLAGNVYWDMRAGDPRRVEESLERFSLGVPAPTPPTVVVLDDSGRIFSSNHVDARSLGGEPAARVEHDWGFVVNRLDQVPELTVAAQNPVGFVSAARVERDGERLGTVLVDYPLSSLRDHFLELFRTAVGYSLFLLLVLLALGWLLGRGLTRPISELRECMRRVGKGDLDLDCKAVQSRDEIGELARGFEEMLSGLREKRFLEQEMLHSERLAAVGQVAAGVAHEINNPLGGMLNAVNTFKRHGDDPAVTSRTIDLLERGLHQIQETVQALLVQARVEAHSLAPADLDDLYTLIQADVRRKAIHLEWDCRIEGRVPLPSTAVRQVLINLLLNAIQAVARGGRVAMLCAPQPGHLWLRVEDNGPGVAQTDVQKLFEPFFSGTGGHGLGLWVTYQTVTQLGGSIEVADLGPGTAMEVRLPYAHEEAAPATAGVAS